MVRKIVNVVILLAALSFFQEAQAQNPTVVLGFPVHDSSGNEINPYTAPIVSVVDHYANPFGLGDNYPYTVQAYTGEEGSGVQCGLSGTPCGRYNPNFLPPLNGQSALELALVGSEGRLHGLSFARLFAPLNHNVFYWICKIAALWFGATIA